MISFSGNRKIEQKIAEDANNSLEDFPPMN